MRITSKGQVTIPKGIRDRMGLLPHSEVEFAIEGGVVTLKRAENQSVRGQQIIARMRGRATTKMTTGEIMALTREE